MYEGYSQKTMVQNSSLTCPLVPLVHILLFSYLGYIWNCGFSKYDFKNCIFEMDEVFLQTGLEEFPSAHQPDL
jgi:hypothetical protein